MDVVGVRFKNVGKIYYFSSNNPGTHGRNAVENHSKIQAEVFLPVPFSIRYLPSCIPSERFTFLIVHLRCFHSGTPFLLDNSEFFRLLFCPESRVSFQTSQQSLP